MKKIIEVSSTSRGYAAIWEQGGALPDLSKGYARIITGPHKEAKPFICLPKNKTINGEHCLILLMPGDYIVECHMENNNGVLNISFVEWQVTAILMDFKAELEADNKSGLSKITIPLQGTGLSLWDAVENDICEQPEHIKAAIKMALTRNCKSVGYVNWDMMDANLARKILKDEGKVIFSEDKRMQSTDPKEIIRQVFRSKTYNEALEFAKNNKFEVLMLEDIPYGVKKITK